MRKLTVLALVLVFALGLTPGVISAQQIEDCTISFLTVWSGEDELPNWENMVQPFVEETGCTIEVESTRDLVPVLTTRVEAGNPPDVAGIPSFGAIQTFIDEGDVFPLDFLDVERMQSQFGEVWMELGSVDGTLYGVFPRAALKSLIWYNPKALEAGGYAVPTSWDELLETCDQMLDDGVSCFAVGLESGAASGWPATDWVEDIMLRTAPLEAYDNWVSHGIPWTGDEVRGAWETFGEIAGNGDYLYGGSAGTLSTNFGESVCALFTDPPSAYFHRQASFIQSFIADCPGGDALVPGEDFDFFLFPEIDPEFGNPGLGSADLFVMFNDSEGARALMDFLTQPDVLAGWLEGGGSGIATNLEFPLDAYPDPLSRRAAEALAQVDAFRFDASDQMPGDVNQAFWTGTLNFVQNPGDIDSILQSIEDVAVDAYGATE
ncbi:MAG: carbohydrate ABC transporter substrate-binding protein [Chloroflexi bacterium]|nr:carbohydrate ABC transporter substrate-binding protein [Chloroflexota bacterium]